MHPFELIWVFDLIRHEWVSADTWHDVVMTTLAKDLYQSLNNRREGSEKQDKIGRQYKIDCIGLASEPWFWNFLISTFSFLIVSIILGFLYFHYLYIVTPENIISARHSMKHSRISFQNLRKLLRSLLNKQANFCRTAFRRGAASKFIVC